MPGFVTKFIYKSDGPALSSGTPLTDAEGQAAQVYRTGEGRRREGREEGKEGMKEKVSGRAKARSKRTVTEMVT